MAVGSMSSSKRSLLRILCAIILLLFLVFRQYRQLWHLVPSYNEYYEAVNEPVYEHYPTTPAIADERKQQDVVHHIVGDSFFPRLIGLDEGAPRPPYMADKNRAERADDVEVKKMLFLAPWDPVWAKGGADRLLSSSDCQADIQNYCQDTHPVRNCLEQQQHKGKISKACQTILDPCQGWNMGTARQKLASHPERAQACLTVLGYGVALPKDEREGMERLLQNIDQAAYQSKASYWMTAGSGIGGLIHHTQIPWDDDIDIYVVRKHMDLLFQAFKGLEIYKEPNIDLWKVFEANASSAGRSGRGGWPSIDLFAVDCDETHCTEKAIPQRQAISAPKDWIFPLKRRPFGRLSLPFPNQLQALVEDRYSTRVRDKCVVGGYSHRKENFRQSRKMNFNCTDVYFHPIYVVQKGGPETTPWPSHPEFTVERVMDGSDTVLSSVIFDQGQETRRSYADGLMGVQGGAISFTIPVVDKDDNGNHQNIRPVPFLLKERQAYLRNVANRSAETLNLEVMPMLNRVEVSNRYGTASAAARTSTKTLKIVAWNAERGTDWDVLPEFAPDPDLLILNEMDWGMARSGNVHTTPLLADRLQMNYAYGVEFLELTHGNAREINATATLGQNNNVGYHGNVAMSKWPIVETKVVRLHPLYDHLYKSKEKGMDAGERRLGGRMALFAITQLPDDQKILMVAAHGHGGAKKDKLLGDARLLCQEIQSFSNITAVVLGGDLPSVLVTELYNLCHTLPLQTTNNYRPNGKRPIPTWRVDCPNGEKPRARFERGDWLVAKGMNVTQHSSVQTIHPFKRLPDGKYDCISDHSIILFSAELA